MPRKRSALLATLISLLVTCGLIATLRLWLPQLVQTVMPAVRNATAASPSIALDVDGDGQVIIDTDIVYIVRVLSQSTPLVPPSYRALDPTIPPDSTIAAKIDTLRQTGTPKPPVLNLIGNQMVSLGTTLTLQLTATDPNGDALTFSAVPLPDHTSLNAATGFFSFSPVASQVGDLPLTFRGSDGTLTDSEPTTITVQGAPPNGTTALTGRVLDTTALVQNGTELPVVGAIVSLFGTSFSIRTDNTGRFTLSGIPAGDQVLDINTATANPAPMGLPTPVFVKLSSCLRV